MSRSGVVAGWIGLVRRRWGWGVGAGSAVLGLAAAIVLLARPVHRAEAALRLGEAPPAPGVSAGGNLLGFFRMGGDPFANDLELLGSRTLAERVTETVALDVQVRAPIGWYRDSLFVAVRGTRATAPSTFRLRWEPDGAVSVQRTSPRDSVVGRAAVGAPVRVAGAELVPGTPRSGAPGEVDVRVVPFQEAVRSTRSRLEIERVRREANVVRIRFDDTDPRVAEQVVEAAVREFITLRAQIFARESSETVDSLRSVAGRTRADLAAAEAAVAELQRTALLIAPDAQAAEGIERFVAVEAELEGARLEMEALDATLARASAPASAGASGWTTLAALPRFLDNETTGALLTRLTLLEEQRTALVSRRTPESLEYRTIVEQMRVLEATLVAVASSYREGVSERIAGLESTVASLRRDLVQVPEKALELARRQREVRLLGEVYLLTEQRLRQEELREALSFSNVQVIDPPQLQIRPIWPRKKLGLAIGFVLALGCAAATMLLVEIADGTVRSARDVAARAGAPVVAALWAGDDAVRPFGSEVASLLDLGAGAHPAPGPLVLAPVDAADERRAQAVATLLRGPTGTREVRSVPAVRSYADAHHARGDGATVVLVSVHGVTPLASVERAARLLREAGGAAGGVAVLVRSEAEAVELWA